MRFLQFTDEDGQPVLIREDAVLTVKAWNPGGSRQYTDSPNCHSELTYAAGSRVDCLRVRETIDLVAAVCLRSSHRPSFDEWFKARNGGKSFADLYIKPPGTFVNAFASALAQSLHEYVSEEL